MNISRRVLSSPDDYGTRGAFSWEGEKKKVTEIGRKRISICYRSFLIGFYRYTDEKLITILDILKKLCN